MARPSIAHASSWLQPKGRAPGAARLPAALTLDQRRLGASKPRGVPDAPAFVRVLVVLHECDALALPHRLWNVVV